MALLVPCQADTPYLTRRARAVASTIFPQAVSSGRHQAQMMKEMTLVRQISRLDPVKSDDNASRFLGLSIGLRLTKTGVVEHGQSACRVKVRCATESASSPCQTASNSINTLGTTTKPQLHYYNPPYQSTASFCYPGPVFEIWEHIGRWQRSFSSFDCSIGFTVQIYSASFRLLSNRPSRRSEPTRHDTTRHDLPPF